MKQNGAIRQSFTFQKWHQASIKSPNQGPDQLFAGMLGTPEGIPHYQGRLGAAHMTHPIKHCSAGHLNFPQTNVMGPKSTYQIRRYHPNPTMTREATAALGSVLRCAVSLPQTAFEHPCLTAYKICQLQTRAACRNKHVHRDPIPRFAMVDPLAACQPLKAPKMTPPMPEHTSDGSPGPHASPRPAWQEK